MIYKNNLREDKNYIRKNLSFHARIKKLAWKRKKVVYFLRENSEIMDNLWKHAAQRVVFSRLKSISFKLLQTSKQ